MDKNFELEEAFMWPFQRKKSAADQVIEQMDGLIGIAERKWDLFCTLLPFKDDVQLKDRIAAFMVPFSEGARKNVPALKAAPEGVILLIAAKGIERSGSHSRKEIEEALGIQLPS